MLRPPLSPWWRARGLLGLLFVTSYFSSIISPKRHHWVGGVFKPCASVHCCFGREHRRPRFKVRVRYFHCPIVCTRINKRCFHVMVLWKETFSSSLWWTRNLVLGAESRAEQTWTLGWSENKNSWLCEWRVYPGSSPWWTSGCWDARRRPDLKDGCRAVFLPVWCLSESSIPGPSHTSTVRVMGCFWYWQRLECGCWTKTTRTVWWFSPIQLTWLAANK